MNEISSFIRSNSPYFCTRIITWKPQPGLPAISGTKKELQKQLFERQMETFAGFAEHTDAEVGRLVAQLEKIGALENTLSGNAELTAELVTSGMLL